MRLGLSTLALAAALTACSKPNPLFLDTWGGVSEGSSQASAETTDEPTATTASASSVDPTATTTTTTVDETTTAGPTATSEPPTGTTSSTGSECTQKDLMIRPANDTFLVRALPSGAPVCALYGDEENFIQSKCADLEFGQQPIMSVFNDLDPADPMMVAERLGVYVLDFARDDEGQLLPDDGEPAVVPVEAIEQVFLQLAYSNPSPDEYDQLIVDLYAIPPEIDGMATDWHEGPGKGNICKAGANLACQECSPQGPPACAAKWGGKAELEIAGTQFIGNFSLPGAGPEGTIVTIPLDRKYFGIEGNRGFVIVPKAIKLGEQQVGEGLKPGRVRMHAEEYEDDAELRPGLVVKACL